MDLVMKGQMGQCPHRIFGLEPALFIAKLLSIYRRNDLLLRL